MKRLMILAAVAIVTASAVGCANRNHCGAPTPAPAMSGCGPTGAYSSGAYSGGGAFIGSPAGVYTGPDGYLPTPN